MLNTVSSTSQVQQNAGCEDVKNQIAVKMLQEVQKSQQIVGNIIEDTVSISQEAINACNSEK